MRRAFVFLAAPVLLLLVALSVILPRHAQAHGIVDQQNEGPGIQTNQIQFSSPIGQEFTPSEATVVAVDVNLATMNNDGDDTITLRIRDATIGGTILGSTSEVVSQGFDGWQHFDLPAPVPVVTGQTYVIHVTATKTTHGLRISGDLYAGGRVISQGSPSAGGDLLFRIYSEPVSCLGDIDCDSINDTTETACGSDPNDANSIPERIDGVFVGVDDDGDAMIDEALPPGSEAFDCDGDGYVGADEQLIFGAANTANDQDPCGGNGWPSDLSPIDPGGPGNNTGDNFLTLQDIGSFFAPVTYFGIPTPPPGYERWDLKPGIQFPFPTVVNLPDLAALLAGSSGSPPMFGGTSPFVAFFPPSSAECPWAP